MPQPKGTHFPETPAPLTEEVDYPSYDGIPFADNTDQAEWIVFAFNALRAFFWIRNGVFVATNLLLYYREGDNKTRITPDVMVAVGRPKGYRGSYKIWEEGHHPPDWVLEVASGESVEVDVEEKPGTYAGIGVREYWQYDPSGGLLNPRLQGRRLSGLEYTDSPQDRVAGAEVAIYSEVLGLRLEFDGERLRFWDPVDQRYLYTPRESEVGRLEAERRIAIAERRIAIDRRATEAAKRRIEAAKRRIAIDRRATEAAKRRIEAAKRGTEIAKRRAEAAERRVEELQTQIASLRAGTKPPDGSKD